MIAILKFLAGALGVLCLCLIIRDIRKNGRG